VRRRLITVTWGRHPVLQGRIENGEEPLHVEGLGQIHPRAGGEQVVYLTRSGVGADHDDGM